MLNRQIGVVGMVLRSMTLMVIDSFPIEDTKIEGVETKVQEAVLCNGVLPPKN